MSQIVLGSIKPPAAGSGIALLGAGGSGGTVEYFTQSATLGLAALAASMVLLGVYQHGRLQLSERRHESWREQKNALWKTTKG